MNELKTRPSRMGKNPLDAMLAPKKEDSQTMETPLTEKKRTRKVRATFHLPPDLFEAARDAVVALSGPPARLTLADLAEKALRKELEALQREHNQSKPFPKRQSALRGGRPIDS